MTKLSKQVKENLLYIIHTHVYSISASIRCLSIGIEFEVDLSVYCTRTLRTGVFKPWFASEVLVLCFASIVYCIHPWNKFS